MFRARTAVTCVVLLMCCGSEIVYAARYKVIDLGTAPNSGLVWARGINDKGQIVGARDNGDACLYDKGKLVDLTGSLTPEGDPEGGAFAVNNKGVVVGSFRGRAFICRDGEMSVLVDLDAPWRKPDEIHSPGRASVEKNGTMHDLGFSGGPTSCAVDVNASGQIVGVCAKGPFPHAFLYQKGTMIDLGEGAARGINAYGDVVGRAHVKSATGSTGLHAFLYSKGKLQDLGTFGGEVSEAEDINDKGQVVGSYEAAAASGKHRFLEINGRKWDLGPPVSIHGFIYENGKMTELGGLGGRSTKPHAVNSKGQVVGGSKIASGEEHAFLYSDGKMVDLNTFIDRSSGWILKSATDINDSGQIVGDGLHNGHECPFLLTPVQ